MVCLIQLPNDIFQLILDHISPEQRRQTLIALSQTCRAFLNLLGPEIYHDVVWRDLYLTIEGIERLNKGLLSPFIRDLTFHALNSHVPSPRKQIPVDRKTHWHSVDFQKLWKKDSERRNLPDLLARIEDLPDLEAVHIHLPLYQLSEEVDSFLHGYSFPDEIQDKEAVYHFAQRIFERLALRPLSSSSKSISRTLSMYGNMKNQMDAFSTPAWRHYLGTLTSFWHDRPTEAEYSLKEALYDHLTSITSLTITDTSPEQLQSLLTPTSVPCLQHLSLQEARYDKHLATFILAHAPRLITLKLPKQHSYDYQGSLSICFQPNSMPQLKHLHLSNLPINPITLAFLASHITQLETLTLECYCHSQIPTSTSPTHDSQITYSTLFNTLLSRQPSSLQTLQIPSIEVAPECWAHHEYPNIIRFCHNCIQWSHTIEDYALRHWFFAYHHPGNSCPKDLLENLPEESEIDWAATKAAARSFEDARAWVELRRWLEGWRCRVDGPEIGAERLPWDDAWDWGVEGGSDDEEGYSEGGDDDETETRSDGKSDAGDEREGEGDGKIRDDADSEDEGRSKDERDLN